MKTAAAILILNLMCGVCTATPSFYVWQQLWSSNVTAAVRAEPATTMYPVAAVVPAAGKSRLVAIPWEQLGGTKHDFVPTVRIPLKAFNRADIEDELVRIAQQLDRFGEIQLDLDCPESRLEEYTGLVRRLRKRIPQKQLSITALPSHLDNRTFPALAAAVDYYVVQVHGLSVPQRIDEQAELMNPAVAQRALAEAESIGRPYAVALPCYAYEMNFDGASGRFLFLTAERPARRAHTVKRRIAAHPADLVRLLSRIRTLEHARGIIWFRLPVEGDRLCLPRPALKTIMQGALPGHDTGCTAHPISGSTLELSLRNGNVIDFCTAEVEILWPYPRGAFDLYQGAEADGHPPGFLPERIVVELPPPGRTKKIGWFSALHPPTLTVKLK